MKQEVLAAVTFIMRFIEKSETFPKDQLENFKKYLTENLIKRFEKHWFPELPSKGQGYRCIRINSASPVDLSLELAASKCGFSYQDLRLPTELTVWVDPSEVCYRLGESEGSYCTLATFPVDSSSQSDSSSSVSSLECCPPFHQKEEDIRKVQKYSPQRYRQEVPNKIRDQSVSIPCAKPSHREVNLEFQNPYTCRYDGSFYPIASAYRNMYHNRSLCKNILRV